MFKRVGSNVPAAPVNSGKGGDGMSPLKPVAKGAKVDLGGFDPFSPYVSMPGPCS